MSELALKASFGDQINKSWFKKTFSIIKFLERYDLPTETVEKTASAIVSKLDFDRAPEIVFTLASLRVENGEPFQVVAAQHGIKRDSEAFDALQMMAVNGRAGERVSAGGSCLTVAE